MNRRIFIIVILVIGLFFVVNELRKGPEHQDDAFKISQAKNTAMTLLMVNKYDSAIENFNNALALDPNDSEAYFGRAMAYAGKEDFNQTIKDYTKAIEIDPKYIEAYSMRSEIYKKIGNMDLAEKDLQKAASLKSL